MLTADAIGAAIKGKAPVMRQDKKVGNDFSTRLASSCARGKQYHLSAAHDARVWYIIDY